MKYHHVKVVSDETILWMSIVGFGKFIHKSNVLYIEEEQRMLAEVVH
jgi:hypothetical protein